MRSIRALGIACTLGAARVLGFKVVGTRSFVGANVGVGVARAPYVSSTFFNTRRRVPSMALMGDTLGAMSQGVRIVAHDVADMIEMGTKQSQQVGALVLAYSDDIVATKKSVAFMSEIIGVSGVATVGLFVGLASFMKLQKPAETSLTEEEVDAVNAASLVYDANQKDQELTESGTVGEVKRKALAQTALEQYQRGKDPREVRGKTLSYAEFDLSYLAKMLRVAQPKPGNVFVDMGSGTGKACVATGLLYPELAVCRGVELLQGLHREAQGYARKYSGVRRPKSNLEFVQADFCDEAVDLSDADIVFAYATKYATERGIYLTELSKKLLELKSGAKVITIDKRLQGPFKLITTVLDPSGDLQSSTGFLWERQ